MSLMIKFPAFSRSKLSNSRAERTNAAAFKKQWKAVESWWTLERFLPTTDLQINTSERAALRNIHDWRFLIPKYMSRLGLDSRVGDLYCFGVAHGGTVASLKAAFAHYQVSLPHMHLFDSFEGLPLERSGLFIPPVWHRGSFAKPREFLQQRLDAMQMSSSDYTIHAGWFKDSLARALAAGEALKCARYIDIDADLYISTVDALDFLFANRLVRPGTLIGYDDWGDTPLWEAGESLAHSEILRKYSADCIQLFSWGEPPLIRKLFLVRTVGGTTDYDLLDTPRDDDPRNLAR